MIEVERKYRLNSGQAVSVGELLRAWGAGPPSLQTDRVFLYEMESFERFKPGQPVLRVRRQAHGPSTITLKRAVGDDGDALEHETEVGSADTMESLLEEMGYICVVEVVKERTSVQRGRLMYSLDEVTSLGTFLEIELLAESTDLVEELTAQISQAARLFGLGDESVERCKYDVLLAAAHSDGDRLEYSRPLEQPSAANPQSA